MCAVCPNEHLPQPKNLWWTFFEVIFLLGSTAATVYSSNQLSGECNAFSDLFRINVSYYKVGPGNCMQIACMHTLAWRWIVWKANIFSILFSSRLEKTMKEMISYKIEGHTKHTKAIQRMLLLWKSCWNEITSRVYRNVLNFVDL